MKRRDFLVLSAGAVALPPAARSRIVLTETTTPESAARKATRLITAGLETERPLGHVWLKATFGWARPAGFAVNTNPAVVGELCTVLLGLGAKRITIVDRFFQGRRYVEQVNGFSALSRPGSIVIAALPCAEQTEADRSALLRLPDSVLSVEPAKHHAKWGYSGVLHPTRLLPPEVAGRFRGAVLDATRVLRSGGPEGGGSDIAQLGMIGFSRIATALDDWGIRATGLVRRP